MLSVSKKVGENIDRMLCKEYNWAIKEQRSRAEAARLVHAQEVGGSNPSSATKERECR